MLAAFSATYIHNVETMSLNILKYEYFALCSVVAKLPRCLIPDLFSFLRGCRYRFRALASGANGNFDMGMGELIHLNMVPLLSSARSVESNLTNSEDNNCRVLCQARFYSPVLMAGPLWVMVSTCTTLHPSACCLGDSPPSHRISHIPHVVLILRWPIPGCSQPKSEASTDVNCISPM